MIIDTSKQLPIRQILTFVVCHHRADLVPMNWCGQSQALTRSVLFDVGAGGPASESEHSACIARVNASTTSELHRQKYHCKALRYRGFISLPLWINFYAARCIHFDRIYAWESKAYDAEAWWSTLTPSWRMKTSFYNVAIDREPPTTPSTGMSVLQWVRESVVPDDFVVLKLDIDHSPTELSIMHTILQDARLLERIDELWFEYHFRFDRGVEFGWKNTHFNKTVDDALALMRDLRMRGVRAHFWV